MYVSAHEINVMMKAFPAVRVITKASAPDISHSKLVARTKLMLDSTKYSTLVYKM